MDSNKDISTLIDELILDIIREATDTECIIEKLLGFLVSERVLPSNLPQLALLLDEIQHKLSLKSKLYLKEIKLLIIRLGVSDTPKEAQNVLPTQPVESGREFNQLSETNINGVRYDRFGVVKPVQMSKAEIDMVLSKCTVSPEELPRVPGHTYFIDVKNGNQHGGINFKVSEDGSMRMNVSEQSFHANKHSTNQGGFNQKFEDAVVGDNNV